VHTPALSFKGDLVSSNTINILQGISAALAILGALGLAFRWLIKHYLSELRPNHGSSLNDKINLEVIPMLKELRTNQEKIALKVAKLEGRFEQHVDDEEAE
jgi:hypothetical protein